MGEGEPPPPPCLHAPKCIAAGFFVQGLALHMEWWPSRDGNNLVQMYHVLVTKEALPAAPAARRKRSHRATPPSVTTIAGMRRAQSSVDVRSEHGTALCARSVRDSGHPVDNLVCTTAPPRVQAASLTYIFLQPGHFGRECPIPDDLVRV